MFVKIYEDNALGKLSDDNYNLLSETYKTEQAQLRQEYRDGIKANLTGQLQNIEFVDKK